MGSQASGSAMAAPVSLLRHCRAVLPLPFNVAVVVPTILSAVVPPGPRPLFGLAQLSDLAVFAVGVLFGVTGLTLFIWTNRLFHTKGEGTLAPWDPPKHFVVEGPYGHVRNPMILGVICVLLAEGLLSGQYAILAWAALFFLLATGMHAVIEEPKLRERFGAEYEEYTQHVRRWIPRI